MLKATESVEKVLGDRCAFLIKDVFKGCKDEVLLEIEKNLCIVKGLEKSNMYGAAINVLKKSIDILTTRYAKSHHFQNEVMNKYLIRCNTDLAYCYIQVNEFRLAIEYARTALSIN